MSKQIINYITVVLFLASFGLMIFSLFKPFWFQRILKKEIEENQRTTLRALSNGILETCAGTSLAVIGWTNSDSGLRFFGALFIFLGWYSLAWSAGSGLLARARAKDRNLPQNAIDEQILVSLKKWYLLLDIALFLAIVGIATLVVFVGSTVGEIVSCLVLGTTIIILLIAHRFGKSLPIEDRRALRSIIIRHSFIRASSISPLLLLLVNSARSYFVAGVLIIVALGVGVISYTKKLG